MHLLHGGGLYPRRAEDARGLPRALDDEGTEPLRDGVAVDRVRGVRDVSAPAFARDRPCGFGY
jgi:hypothetical protein